MVGEVATSARSDEEVWQAMVSLEEPVLIAQEFTTVEGDVARNTVLIEAF